jgi:hypothetical protein
VAVTDPNSTGTPELPPKEEPAAPPEAPASLDEFRQALAHLEWHLESRAALAAARLSPDEAAALDRLIDALERLMRQAPAAD